MTNCCGYVTNSLKGHARHKRLPGAKGQSYHDGVGRLHPGGRGGASENDVRCTCGTTFSDDEHRCPHCGRRVQTILLPDSVSTATATRPAPELAVVPDSRVEGGKPRQPNLFGGQKVVPFETLVSTRRQYGRRRDTARPQPEPRAAVRPAQQALELRAPAAAFAPAAEYGDARIAGVGLRARAAALDALICVLGLSVFAATFYLMGGSFSFSRAALPWWIAAAAGLVTAYHLFFAAVGRNTAGMSHFRIAVVTFDGVAANSTVRIARLLSAIFGTAALGLGLVWALFDDEQLAWHDHITKTFPTPLDREPGTLRRH